MFQTILNEVTGLFDSGKDFVRTYYFPVLAWVAGFAAVVSGSQSEAAARVEQFQKLSTVIQIGWIALILAVVAVLASVLASVRLSTLRLYEGYWPRYMGRVATALAATHRAHLLELKDRDAAAYAKAVYYEYPNPEWDGHHMMPTRLGNVLKASERYSTNRYGADAVLMWPRLYPLLEDELRKDLDASQSAIDFGITVSLLSWSFAWIGGTLMLVQGRNWVWFVTVFVGLNLLGFLAYRAAVAAAVSLGELVRAAFDLYRSVLLEKLGLEKLDKPDANRPMDSDVLWRSLTLFVYYGSPEFRRRKWPPQAAEPPPDTATRVRGSISGPLIHAEVDMTVSKEEAEPERG